MRPTPLRPVRITLPLLGLLAAWALNGCVTVHAPLRTDARFPDDWGEIVPLGPDCKAIEGSYADAGSLAAAAAGEPRTASLLGILGLDARAGAVSLAVDTQAADPQGDARATLYAVSDGDAPLHQELRECFCVRQTLFCTTGAGKIEGAPGVGLGGSQANLYFGLTPKRDLVVKLQTYDAGILLGLPLFNQQEHWLRFAATAP